MLLILFSGHQLVSAVSSVANFGFTLGLYSNVLRSSVSISVSPEAFFVFLKNPCFVFIAQPFVLYYFI